ncbi:aconitate hydratase AcnA [Advenella sp. S44]|uniref:aconitate hydratase AcnA n=1 Tax=Advenella sp. S44 TaxID=1982755 RepID=UPI001F5B131A|nr:aconitate hydratase AcnA [Advenella sp. S44]
MRQQVYAMTKQIQIQQQSLRYTNIHDITAASGQDLSAFPYVIRVLLENVCRHKSWGANITENEVAALLKWNENVGAELALHVARVILPDSSGLPVLQDLAALRDAVARNNGDPATVDTQVPVDLIVDHSLQVDNWKNADAMSLNLRREFERNNERYEFLKWAQQAFRGLRVFPPGTGIIHQVNLEYIASVVMKDERKDGAWLYPDFVIGGDSHTPMINALGVLGWGVGGIDAEAALLGHAYTFPIPEVVGVRLVGSIAPPAMTTDAALLITEALRMEGVTGTMIEFFGPALPALSVQERATIANMAPEYGATCGFFPVDVRTLEYLLSSGRDPAHVHLIEAYCKANGLFRSSPEQEPRYSRVLEIDLSRAQPSVAGPRRPQDRLPIHAVAADFRRRLDKPLSEDGFGAHNNATRPPRSYISSIDELDHGAVVLAAITSCTNTSNPSVMLAAGLIARKAVALGLTVPAWVKTSLAPGSRTVTRYLKDAGLLQPLATLGFHLIGYGCTTCGGKSGPLDDAVIAQIEKKGLVVAAALSGNRNFEGRIHKLIRANYIGAPPLVVAYALAGRIDIDFERDPVGHDSNGKAIYLQDVWPTPDDIAALLPLAGKPETFSETYHSAVIDTQMWRDMHAPEGVLFPWNPDSHYLIEPPFFKHPSDGDGLARLAQSLDATRVLAAFGDSLTTDHISPGGEIPSDTPAGQYLLEAGITPRDFNSYVARRCNYQIMTRATFANIRTKNQLVPEVEGGFTRYFPDDIEMTIFEAATRYQQEGHATIILAGKEYGTGSSRDWAAKGTALLGIQAVIAESYERIHRANLVGMGVLPLAFQEGEGWRQLGLTGSESFHFENVEAGITNSELINVSARQDGREIRFQVRPQVLTAAERHLIMEGGIPRSVLRGFLQAND